MEPLPDLQFQLSSYSLTPSESALIEQSKQELSDLLLHKIDEIKDRFSSIASNTLQQVTHTFQKEILSQADSLLNLSIKPIDLSQSKKILQSFQHSIESLERLIFLSRYFNPDNDEEYLKNLGPRAIKLTKMIYNLNNYIFTWITALLENTQFDPKDMLPILLDSKEKGINAVSNDLLIVKLPSRSLDDISSPSSALLLDYYYLNLTYQNINRLIETFTKYKVPENIKNIVHSFKEETGSNSPALLRLGESFINSNPVTLELTRELENLKKSKEGMHALGCLYEPKGLLDKSVRNVAQYEDEIRTVAEKYISQAFARREDTISDQEEIPLEKIDEVVVQEIQGNCNNDRDKLKDFLKGWEAESKAEILRMLARQKEMLQDHMSKYIEERLVTFQQGKGDFANVNFAKLVQEFCSTAKKEYKKVLPARTDQEYEIWPLYYCYVAENQCDFYLVEYMTDSTALRVYLTAAPMLSTLYKHLSKLDMAKIGKKNVLVTILNYYDMDVNLEFRQVFRSGEVLEVDQSKQNKISQGIKDLIFITVFLLYNTPSQPLSEINLTAKDFAAFFNYTADFHLIYHQYLTSFPGGVPPQGKSNTTSPTLSPQKKPFASFDFRAPFIDLNQPKNMFLIHYKGELSRENSVLIMRNMVQQYGEGLQYQYLTIDEEMNRPDFLDMEIAKYLKKGETKIAYNFDGTEYLSTYLRRKNPQEAPITIISKKHSQKLLDMFRSGTENRELLLDLEDYSKYARLYLIFSYTGDNFPGLMIYADRKTRTVSIYRHTRQTVEENDVLRDFASFMGKLFGLEESMMYLKQVRCIIKEDLVLKHLKNYYFPYACLLDSTNEGLEGDIVDLNITMYHLINSFKDFMAINLAEKSLEAFKACNLVVEEKSKAALKTINLGTILKFNRLKTTLIALAEKIAQEKVHYMLVSFNFVGATGYKTYYVYFKETSGSPEETGYGLQSPGLQTVNGKVRYIVDIYTLESNLPQDDQEVLVIVAHVCQTVASPGLFLNAAYIIKAKHNILLYNQVDLTLNTLAFLAQLGNIPMEKAFSRISRSVVNHYDVLEGFLDQISVLTQAPSSFFVKQRSLSAPQNSEVFDMSSGKIMDPQGRLARVRASLLKKVTMLDSFFEDLPAQAVFKKNVDTQALELLQTNDARYFTEGFDIYNFLDGLNAEDNPTPGFYSYAVDEQVMRKLLTNEGSVVKNVSKFLIEEVMASKESQEVKYPETLLFFLVSPSLFDISKVILITYNVERAESTFFYTKQFNEHREPRSRLNLTQGGIEEEDAEQQSSERIRENIVTISKGESRDYITSRENVGHEHHEEMKTSERSKDYSRTDDFSVLEHSGFLKHDGHDYGVPENLRKLMESFSQVAVKNKKTKDKPRARYFELSFDQNVTKMLKSQYGLVVKFLMHYFTHQGTKQKSSSLHITTSMFNGFLCDFADRLFVSYIETSRIMENSKMLCNMFLEKNNPLGKKIALLAFLNGRANVEQIGVIENCIKSFKQDFQKIYGIENAFFCFTINMKQSYKHFLLHLSGKAKKNLTLNIFTNGTSDADSVVDKMIRTYCLEEATTGGEDILIGKLQVYNMNMPNVLFMKYSEITTVLLANAVCNDVEDAVGYCANLAYSPVHYLKELRDFEDKCDKLGILLDIQRTTSQASFASQMSPT